MALSNSTDLWVSELSDDLLRWYDLDHRQLPWRAASGGQVSAYKVWLSEIMLQQTTVKTVKPYFIKFLKRWPSILDLANASLDDVLHAWQGLGYYARARNMLKCAQTICVCYEGEFPSDKKELLKLPGIGPYTAAAIVAIAFNRLATVVDGNVERVISRLQMIETSLPKAKKEIYNHAKIMTPIGRPGDYAQAIMDLGATVCRPKKPLCHICPWQQACVAYRDGQPENYPRKSARGIRKFRYGAAFWLVRRDGSILLRRRPSKGLLGGLIEVPTTDWRDTPWENTDIFNSAPNGECWSRLPNVIRHDFTHFRLELIILCGTVDGRRNTDGLWCDFDTLDKYAISTLSKKIVGEVAKYSVKD